MKVICTGSLLTALLLTFAKLIAADCCKEDKVAIGVDLCKDGTVGTPYCGIGQYNIFGCNCDGGT